MKRFYKYSAILAAAAITAFSCSKVETSIPNDNTPKINVMVDASVPEAENAIDAQNGIDTKVSITEGDIWNVQWQKGDKLGGWSNDATGFTEFSMVTFTDGNGKKASFSGTLAENTAARLLYPYDADASVITSNKYSISVANRICDMNLPYNELSDKSYMISDIREAAVNWDNIVFHNLMSALKIRLKFSNLDDGSYLKRIVIEGNGTTVIYNSAKLDLSKATLTDVVTDKTSGSVSVGIENSPLLADGTIYEISTMLIPTTVYSGDNNKVKITVYTTGKKKTFEAGPDSDTDFERGKYYSISKLCDMSDATGCTDLLGSGTAEDPYLISSKADLAALATAVNGGNDYNGIYFLMTDCIDLGGSDSPWTPIGNAFERPFKGIFDGNGHSITGLHISNNTRLNGLFGYINESTVKNISVTGNVSSTYTGGDAFTAGIVGRTQSSSTISNCSYYGTVTILGKIAAGITSQLLFSSIIEKCVNYATVTASTSDDFSYIGGIIGYADDATVKECVNRGNISGKGYSGGIVGDAYSKLNIYNCSNYGEIDGSSSSSVGGIAGEMYSGCKVYNSCNFGTVKANSHVGGIAGSSSSIILNCFNVGTISASSFSGALTYSDCTITDSYYLSTCGATGSGTSLSADQMKSNTVVSGTTYFYQLLNSNAGTYNTNNPSSTQLCAWTLNTTSYPDLDFSKNADGTSSISDNWIDSASPNFSGGKGTETNPYLISSAEELARLAKIVNDGNNQNGVHYTLVNDINISGKQWTSIGNAFEKPFKGIFDGNEHSITGLYISNNKQYNGLFGYISGSTVKNISVTGNVSSTYTGGDALTSGIVGKTESSSTISNCSYYGKVTINEKIAAGITSQLLSSSIIEKCVNYATVTASTSGDYSYIGGITGYAADATVKECVNRGNISGKGYSGGIIGDAFQNINIYNCCNYGEIDGSSGSNIGGIVGKMYSNGCNVYNSCNYGTVKASMYVGGIAGSVRYTSLIISNCFNVGTISASSSKGALTSSNCNIVNSYYLSTCGAAGSGTSLTADQMKNGAAIDAVTIGGVDYTTFITILNAYVNYFNNTDPAPTYKALLWSQVISLYPTLNY